MYIVERHENIRGEDCYFYDHVTKWSFETEEDDTDISEADGSITDKKIRVRSLWLINKSDSTIYRQIKCSEGDYSRFPTGPDSSNYIQLQFPIDDTSDEIELVWTTGSGDTLQNHSTGIIQLP